MSLQEPRPRFSLVSAVYGVERYLPAFIDSIEAQSFDLGAVEVVVIDDGSTDGSAQLLAAWAARRPDLVRVVTKDNGGQASARNAGLEVARGEWVTFPDPDDTLAPDYLAQVDKALRRQPRAEMAAAHRVNIDGDSGREVPHPLAVHFNERDRVRNLDQDPDYFAGHAPSTFFRSDRLAEQRLRFDTSIRPNFEDGHFCCRYLLALEAPLVSFVRSAKYRYLKRSDNSSTLATSRGVPSRYTTVLERGYLDVLRRGAERTGTPPAWLQTYVLYELSWYFRETEEGTGTASAPTSVTARMHELLAQIATLLSPEAVETYWLTRMDQEWRDVLGHGYTDRRWHAAYVLADRFDPDQQLMRLRYRFAGPAPQETLLVNGRVVDAAYGKERAVSYFDAELLRERVVWVPTGAIRVLLDDAPIEVLLDPPQRRRFSLRMWQVRRRFHTGPHRPPERTGPPPPTAWRDRALLRLAKQRVVTRWFEDAWVMIDRVGDADDSAEVLFRWTRAQRAGVNAWFVVARSSPDYARLRRDGYRRVVPFGSLRHDLLMLNAAHVISSHADIDILAPRRITRLVRPVWRTTFLNHGVIKDDLSDWLNRKDFDVFVTSTPAEQASIAASGTGYRYTDRETVRSGMPRFDQLLEAARGVPETEQRLLLLAPTWRNWLVTIGADLSKAPLPQEEFLRTEFATSWLGLAGSEELATTAREHGLQVALLLHPNLQPVRDRLALPEHVQLLSFEGARVRDHFARTRLMVTDYSSMAFNAAYLDRPVVYFQFDRERVLSGAHMGRTGYYDYVRDGFGPVAESLPEALRAIDEVAAAGGALQAPYAERVRAAFPERDGRCTERTFAAIEQSTRKVPRADLFR